MQRGHEGARLKQTGKHIKHIRICVYKQADISLLHARRAGGVQQASIVDLWKKLLSS